MIKTKEMQGKKTTENMNIPLLISKSCVKDVEYMSDFARKKASEFPVRQSFSTHAQPLSEIMGLVIWLKFPFGLPLTQANSIGSGETARMRRLA